MQIRKSQLKEIIREVVDETLEEKNWIKGAVKILLFLAKEFS